MSVAPIPARPYTVYYCTVDDQYHVSHRQSVRVFADSKADAKMQVRRHLESMGLRVSSSNPMVALRTTPPTRTT